MDYESKYKNALKWAKGIYQNAVGADKGDLEHYFPELADSEDERIRKAIISGMTALKEQGKETFATVPINDCIAWLEKQGEQKPTTVDIDKMVDDYANRRECGNEEFGKPLPCMIRAYKQGLNDAIRKVALITAWSEEDGQKNQVGTKFKAGDWVVFANGNVGHITSAGTHGYTFDDGDYLLHENCDKQAHLWSITDAKDGDVLACESGWTCIFKALVNDENFSSYCFMDKTKWFCETGSECHTLNKEFTKAYSGEIKPATKEQRETLMKAIADAGYKWDDEKKELIKIEEKSENYKQQVMSEMTDLAEDYIKQKPTNSCNSIDCTPIERF